MNIQSLSLNLDSAFLSLNNGRLSVDWSPSLQDLRQRQAFLDQIERTIRTLRGLLAIEAELLSDEQDAELRQLEPTWRMEAERRGISLV